MLPLPFLNCQPNQQSITIIIIEINQKTSMPLNQQSPDQPKRQYKILKSFLSGGIAGMCSKTLVAPIERVKYLFITSNRQFSYRSYFTDFIYIVKNNGLLNLWRGNMMNIARIFPYSAIDFSVFDFLRHRFYNSNEKTVKQKVILFACGALAGICSMAATTPIEFVRLRLAMEKDNFSYKSNNQAFKKVYANQGFLGFYRGFGASVCGIVIYHGFSFFIFTSVKQIIKKHNPDSYKKWYIDFMTGGISAFGQVLGYPFDIVRKRMQGQFLLLSKNEIEKMMNYKELIGSIWEKQGLIKGFYKGISLNMIKAPLASATAWTVKNYLNRKFDQSYDL